MLELATQVHGVRDVRSLVKISEEAQEIDDISIVNSIESFFAIFSLVDAEDVETSCEKGIVTLIGLVDDNEEKKQPKLLLRLLMVCD